ncbi:hypothetical protein ACPV5O_26380 [Vibrio maritimus]|uniref:hypothetical protein n=1 Tax=Vibrio maritimus TaxID=990268 RepID=UPI0040685799
MTNLTCLPPQVTFESHVNMLSVFVVNETGAVSLTVHSVEVTQGKLKAGEEIVMSLHRNCRYVGLLKVRLTSENVTTLSRFVEEADNANFPH